MSLYTKDLKDRLVYLLTNVLHCITYSCMITKQYFQNIIKNTQGLIKEPLHRVIINPGNLYTLLHYKRLGDGWIFRIIQNKKSGLTYLSFGKEYWEEINHDIICTPYQNGKRMTIKELKAMFETYLDDLHILAKSKILERHNVNLFEIQTIEI
jgi:hypothetical protein